MIYLDYQATTPLAPEAREAMLRAMDGPDGTGYGNPHSQHKLGRQAAATVELARDRVANLLPAGGRVVFTGSATEAINTAMRGHSGAGAIAHSAIEHSAVGDTAEAIGNRHVIPVNADGLTDPEAELLGDTRMIAVMQVNNEIGVVQPIAEWRKRAQDMGALLLVDAVQAAGKMPIEAADLIAITAHKFHGPKGIGALWVRDRVELTPLITGGGQEQDLRSGTVSPALCAGFGAAAQLASEQMEDDAAHIAALWNRARELFSGWALNGSDTDRWHGNLNIRREGLDVARLMSEVRQVAFSAGSACASGSGRPSHVLRALGLSNAEAKSSIRLGFGRYTRPEEIDEAAWLINEAAKAQEV